MDRYAHNTVLRASSVYGVGLLIFIGGLVALLPATGDANHIGTTWVWYVTFPQYILLFLHFNVNMTSFSTYFTSN